MTDNALTLDFHSLRGDWYAGNQVLPRMARQAVEGKRHISFENFPRHWLPVFHLLGLSWSGSIDPLEHVPVFSDLSEEDVLCIICECKIRGTLRAFVESVSICDPILSDFLYIFDHTLSPESSYFRSEVEEILDVSAEGRKRPLLLNGWQSYGRPAVRAIEHAIDNVSTDRSVAVALPCSLKRPYDRSRTHKKIYSILAELNYQIDQLHRVVITSLGVLPEEVWSLSQVMAYDAGVPDIYRNLRLARRYFGRLRYETVLDCLQFEPYSDVLRIVHLEGKIGDLVRIPVPRKRHFYIRSD